jgi:quinol monooxygenase YgiN
MVNLTAVIRCKADHTEAVLKALIAVGDYAKLNEPGTIGYRVIQNTEDPTLLITQESFTDLDAMEAHNAGAGSKAFFTAAEGCLEGVDIYKGVELFTLS